MQKNVVFTNLQTKIPSCIKVKQWLNDWIKTTLAVQSFNVALESSPLETNTIGQLLPGVNTIQLYTFFTRINEFLFLLQVSLIKTMEIFFNLLVANMYKRLKQAQGLQAVNQIERVWPVCNHLGVCRLSALVSWNLKWTQCPFSSAATLSLTLHFPAATPFVGCHNRSVESYTSPLHALG